MHRLDLDNRVHATAIELMNELINTNSKRRYCKKCVILVAEIKSNQDLEKYLFWATIDPAASLYWSHIYDFELYREQIRW